MAKDEEPTRLVVVHLRRNVPFDPVRLHAARMANLANDHRRGEHSYGNKRRDCPLCR